MNVSYYAAASMRRTSAGAIFLGSFKARARPPARAETFERNIVLAYRPGWQSLADLNEICGHIAEIDPTIKTFIAPSTSRNSLTRKRAASRPTLVVSNGKMPLFRPRRGKVYQGSPIQKVEEIVRLAAAGVPVPRTAIITPDLRLDEAEWGEFVIVKPTDIATSSHGRGIQLMRTRRVRFIPPRRYPADHPGRLGPMMVQQFIDTGERLTSFRVTTYFGEPISALTHSGGTPRVALDAPDSEIESTAIAIQAAGERKSEFLYDPEILALARRAHEAVPEIPLKGCDVLRDAKTGALYVIELNAGGNTWHFSSNFMAERRKKYGEAFERMRREQFDAMRTAARVLVERARTEAE